MDPALVASSTKNTGKKSKLDNGVKFALIPRRSEAKNFFKEGRAMNWDRVSGNWKQLKGKVKEKWGDLTDDDLDKVQGKREQLVGKIQQRYGIAKDEAERRVDQWANELEDR
jgi:uncharacterized protein YjbJ (UPF0337 family)